MALDQYALTTREVVHSHRIANGERLNTTPETNNLIDNLINAVSARFESYCDRKFKSRDYTEYQDGKGLDVLYPKQYPITSVSGIYDDSNWEWGAATLVSGTEYRIKNDNCVVFKSSASALGDYSQNVKIVYTGGYSTIPYDLENACVNEVLRALGKIENLELEEKRSNEYLLKYITNSFLKETRMTLDRYRRKVAW